MRKTVLILITTIVVNLLYVATILAQPNLEVSGIMKGKDKRAMINGAIVKEGDTVNGAEVIEISDDSVKFEYECEFFTKKAETGYRRSNSSSEKRIEPQKIEEKQKLNKVEKKTSTGIIIKSISDIESIELYTRVGILATDAGTGLLTIHGYAIFRDKRGRDCAIDYGEAELSCYPWFIESLAIRPEGFKRIEESYNACNGYPIYFEFYGHEGDKKAGSSIFGEPSPEVKFKMGNLEATSSLHKE